MTTRYKLTARDGTTRILSLEEAEAFILDHALHPKHGVHMIEVGGTYNMGAGKIALYTPAEALHDAAPSMYEALKAYVDFETGTNTAEFDAIDHQVNKLEILEKCCAAIALAEHGQKEEK